MKSATKRRVRASISTWLTSSIFRPRVILIGLGAFIAITLTAPHLLPHAPRQSHENVQRRHHGLKTSKHDHAGHLRGHHDLSQEALASILKGRHGHDGLGLSQNHDNNHAVGSADSQSVRHGHLKVSKSKLHSLIKTQALKSKHQHHDHSNSGTTSSNPGPVDSTTQTNAATWYTSYVSQELAAAAPKLQHPIWWAAPFRAGSGTVIFMVANKRLGTT